MVNIKFESRKIDRTENTKIEQVTFYSPTYNELAEYIAENYPEGGDSDRGEVIKTRFYQSGPCWYADAECLERYDEDGLNITAPLRNSAEPQKHFLRTVCRSIELEELSNYRTCWNHCLWAEVDRSHLSIPSSAPASALMRTGTESFTENGVRYVWIAPSGVPGQTTSGDDKAWLALPGFPTKPGITQVIIHTWQITEYGFYKYETAAQWVVRANLNTPRAQPLLGSMGVHSAGNWKLDDAVIEPDGETWRAQLVWTYSPDGWDPDLYPPHLLTAGE